MARRVVWLALILSAASGRPGAAMQSLADPGAQGPVGMAPTRSLDRLNGNPSMAGTAPASGPAPAIGATNPAASGPAATLPGSPGGDAPVSLTPMPPIQKSLDRGYRFGRLSDLFRKDRGQPAQPSQPRAARTDARPTPHAWSPDPAARRSVHPDPVEAPAVAPPKGGRPAPYGDRAPEGPRRQLEPAADPSGDPPSAGGRPNPLAAETPRRARPQLVADSGPSGGRPSTSATAEYRPQGLRPRAGVTVAEAAATAPTQAPSGDPAPPEVVPPGPPPLEPDPARPAEPPVVIPSPEAVAIPTPSPTPEPAPEPPPIVEAPAAVPAAPLAEPLPPAEPTPVPSPAPGPKPAPGPSTTDPAVTRTASDATAIRMNGGFGKQTQFATLRAAAVGDEVITIHELMVAVNERVHDFLDPTQQISAEELKAVKNQLAPVILKSLIEQSLILQEAKRVMKNEKNLKAFNEHVAKIWKDQELPGLLRQHKASSESELKAKLAEQGRSYEGLREAFRKRTLSHEFIMKEVRNKVTADTIEMRAYYNIHEHNYHQPARMSWREVEVIQARYPDREAARKQADAIHARLAKGEDFAAVARAASEGPTASAGGLYADITPGGYGIAAVNEALGKLPVGQLSGVIEAPGSFHIVRVEGRREAGPLHFDEVQKVIRDEVMKENFEKAVKEYIDKLRARTLVRTMFDPPQADASNLRANLKP